MKTFERCAAWVFVVGLVTLVAALAASLWPSLVETNVFGVPLGNPDVCHYCGSHYQTIAGGMRRCPHGCSVGPSPGIPYERMRRRSGHESQQDIAPVRITAHE